MTKRASSASAIADAVLSEPGYRSRLKILRRRSLDFGPELVEEFRARSSAEVRSNPREAVERARLGGIVAFSLGDPAGMARCLRARAQGAILGGDHRGALRSIDQALVQARDLDDPQFVAQLEAMRLTPLVNLERFAQARETGRRILRDFEASGDRKGMLRVRMALADLAFRRDRPREALRHYREVDALLPPGAPVTLQAAIALNRANSLDACNRFRAAQRGFAKAKKLFAEAGADHSVAQVDYNAAYGEMLRGHYADALKRLADVEGEFRLQGDELHLAHIDLDRAEIHIRLNMPEDAREFASRASARFRSLGREKESAEALYLAGHAAELLGDLSDAEDSYRFAESRFGALGLTERCVGCAVQQAQVAEREGRSEGAARLADRAEGLLTEDMSPLTAASVELLQARLSIGAGAPVSALGRADRAMSRCRRIFAPLVEIEAFRLRGLAHGLRGETKAAIAALRQAVDLVERYRGGMPPDEYMASYLAGRAELYADLVEMLVAEGDSELAFEYIERAKSRALADLLADRMRSRDARPEDGPSERRVRYLRERLAGVYGRLFRSTVHSESRSARSVRAVRRQALEIEQEITRILRRGQVGRREGPSLDTVEAPDLDAVRADLDQDTVLLEYFFTGRSLLTFAVSRDQFHLVRQDATEADIRSRLERFHFHLAKYDPPLLKAEELVMKATRANLGELTDMLLTPIERMLDGKRLVIVPHGILHYLPFHALPWSDGWVADRFEVVYAPSAGVYGYCAPAENRGSGDPLVFGLPDDGAPRIAEEAKRVGQILGSERVYLGEHASFDRLRSEAVDSRLVHIATHGMFRHRHPMLSAIRMAEGWVNLYDLYSLNLNADLVVLSTCESGTAEVTRGDEILGLTRGFLYAGASALLTSQWRVDDAATSEFMESFYEHLERGDSVTEAHKAAMADVRAKRPHPYYWAPFFLTGRPAGRTRSRPGDDPPVASGSMTQGEHPAPCARTGSENAWRTK